MHSRIIQIEACPVDESEFITPYAYCDDHWFTNSIADYVAEDEDRTGTLQWLKDTLAPGERHIEYFEEDGNEGFILHQGFLKAYMAPSFEVFEKLLAELTAALNLEMFVSGDLGAKLLTLSSAYDDEYGFYIESPEEGLITLNRFLQYAKPGTRYYIGGTVDYHS